MDSLYPEIIKSTNNLTMTTPEARRRSHDQLLIPTNLEKSDQIMVEVTYQGPKTPTKSRLHSVRSSNPNGNQDNSSGTLQNERILMKNVVIMGITFALVYSSFNALQGLQSSLFTETGLGLKALSLIYGFGVLSSFYGSLIVQKLSANWTMAASFLTFSLFTVSYFYPRPSTVLPAALILGLSLGPLCCAKATYLNQIISKLTCLTQNIRDKLQQRYLRVFHLLSNSGAIFGNLITALILHYSGDIYIYTSRAKLSNTLLTNPKISAADVLSTPGLCHLDQCDSGHVFRNGSIIYFVLPTSISLALIGFYLGVVFVGLIGIIVALEKFDVLIPQDPMERPLYLQSLRSIGLLCREPRQQLLFPIVLFIGLEQGFMYADFTKSYVSCTLGLEAIGYTMMCMGAMNTLGALLVHHFTKHIKRPLIMAAGLTFHVGLLMVLWLWRPMIDDVAVFYVIAAGWGLCHSIWETLSLTYIIISYTSDWQIPYIAYFMYQGLGLTMAYSFAFYLCTEIKIYILAAALFFAILPYSILEFRLHHQQKIQQRTSVL